MKLAQGLLLFLLLILSSCGFNTSSEDKSSKFSVIYGSVPSLQGLVTRTESHAFLAYASTCEAEVALYKLDNNDEFQRPAIATTKLNPDGSYQFKVSAEIQNSKTIDHVLEVSTEGACDQLLQRPLTSTEEPQIISEFTHLISFGRNMELARKFIEIPKSKMHSLLSGVPDMVSATEAYQTMPQEKADLFLEIFSEPYTKLSEATPKIKGIKYPEQVIDEGSVQNFAVAAFHWKPEYEIAVTWKLDGVVVSQLPSWTFSPDGNSAGLKTLEIYVGANNGSNQIDTSKPYQHFVRSFTVNNTILPTPPAMNIDNSLVSDENITVGLLTGAGMANCHSFETMALTTDDTVPVIFPITCVAPNSQLESLTLPPGDGTKTVRLWAKDSMGVISQLPGILNVTLDQTPPEILMTSPVGAFAGGQALPVALSVQDAVGISSFDAFLSLDNGATYAHQGSLAPESTSFQFSLPFSETTGAKIKLVAQDLAGNLTELESSAFAIDTTPPIAPGATLASASLTNQTTILINISSCEGIQGIFVNEDSSPSASAPGWQNCSTESGAITFNMPATQGTHSLKVWAKDAVGNISSATNLAVTYDSIAPTVTLSSLTSGEFLAGGTLQPINWTATDENLGTNPVTIFLSSDGGNSWIILASNLANTGSYSWNVPTGLNGQLYRIKIAVADSLGQSAEASSASNLTIDSTAPSISSFNLNDGAESSATNFLQARINASDSLTGITQVRISPNSTFADNNWLPFTEETFTYIAPFVSATQTFYAWVKDGAGNISEPLSYVITISIGAPPSLSFLAPLNASFSLNQTVHIEWSIVTTIGLNVTSPLLLEWSSDNGITTTTLSSTLINGSNNGCSTIHSGATGCFEFNLPPALVGKPFRLLLRATDINGAQSTIIGPILNVPGLNLFAGKEASLLGGSALGTLLTDAAGALALDGLGNLFIAGGCSIYKVDAKTGNVDRYIGNGSCGSTGIGSPPSPSSKIGTIGNVNMAVDNLNRLYWVESGTVIKRINSDGNVEVFVGGGATPLPPDNTHRLSASFTGVNGLGFDSFNRLIFAETYLSNGNYIAKVYRIKTDDKIEIIAGDGSANEPVNGTNPLTSGLGSTTANWLKTEIEIKKGEYDIIFLRSPHGKIYKINLETRTISFLTEHASNHTRQMVWDPLRNRLVANFGKQIYLYEPDTGSRTQILTSDNGEATGLAVDASGGIYYTTTFKQQIFYINSSDDQSTFAGLTPGWGDGQNALQAGLTKPTSISFDQAGNIYIVDEGVKVVRKITPAGIISTQATISGTNFHLSKGNNGNVPLYAQTSIGTRDINNVCLIFCGTSVQPYSGATDTSASPTSLYPGTHSTYQNNKTYVAFDDDNTYLWIQDTNAGVSPITHRTHIKKIDSTGNMTTLSGGSSVPYQASGSALTIATGTLLSSNNAGSAAHSDAFQVVNGVIYFLQAGELYSVIENGSWIRQLSHTSITSYVVDANNNIFYTVGMELYKAAYSGTGNASGILIKSFEDIFASPMLRLIDPNMPHTLLITHGASVYRYTDELNI